MWFNPESSCLPKTYKIRKTWSGSEKKKKINFPEKLGTNKLSNSKSDVNVQANETKRTRQRNLQSTEGKEQEAWES